MINDLEFLRGEATKIRKVLGEDKAKNHMRYGTLLQSYLTITANVERMENYQAQMAAEEKRKQEEKKAYEQAKKEMEEEEKQKLVSEEMPSHNHGKKAKVESKK